MGPLGGCGLTLDLEPDPDGGTGVDFGVTPPRDLGTDPVDGGPLRECEGREDGTPCGGTEVEPFLCKGGECVPGECGDGFVTGTEVCDDGNTEDGDGCQSDCTPGCVDGDGGCPSTECGVGFCEGGECLSEPAEDGTNCTGGSCQDGLCIAPLCGNGELGDDEECDDGNHIDGDGCESDCTRTCNEESDCQDGVLCNGAERCVADADTGGAQCLTASVLPPVPSPCQYCDESTGRFELIDADGDGFTAVEADGCGPADCDDTNDSIYPGAPENTVGVDSNCDGEPATDLIIRCFFDGDGDGFGDPDESMEISTGGGATCPVDYVPGGPADCNDENALVFPGQLMFFEDDWCDVSGGDCTFDYNCDGREERRFTEPSRCGGLSEAECEAAFAGWANRTVPECGESAAWATCNWNRLLRTCSRSLLPSPVVQSCR